MKITIYKKGVFGKKAVYIYENGIVRTPGFFSKQIFRVKGDCLCEPGIFGKPIGIIKGNAIVELGLFGKTLYTFTKDTIMQGGQVIYTMEREEDKSTQKTPPKSTTSTHNDSTTNPTYTKTPINIDLETVVKITEPTLEFPEYNEVKAYARFFKKYKVIRCSQYMDENMYARWELMNCGVENPKKLHIELEEKGYYIQANTKETLSIYKVGELQNIAKKCGIAVKGKKDEIIDQLSKQLSIDDVTKILKEKVETISKKALEYLEEHSLELEYYELGDESITLEEYKTKRNKFSQNDMEWQKLTKEVMNDKNGLGKNAYYSMGGLLEREGKNKDALDKYLRVLYLEANGVEGYNRWERAGKPKDVHLPILIAPGLCKDIRNLKEYYSAEMIDRVYQQPIPCITCSKTMFTKMIDLIMADKFDSFEYEEILTKEFIKNAK